MISGRALLLTLVGLNLVALLWWTGQLAPLFGSVLEPQRLSRQIQPDMLRVVQPSPRASVSPVVAGVRETAPVVGRVGDVEAAAVGATGERAQGVAGPSDEGDGRAATPPSGSTAPHRSAGGPSAGRAAGASEAVAAVPADVSAAVTRGGGVQAAVNRAAVTDSGGRAQSAAATDRVTPADDAPAASPAQGAAAARSAPVPGGGDPAGDRPGDLAMRGPGDAQACLTMDDLSYPEYQERAQALRSAGMSVSGERTSAGRYVVYVGPLENGETAQARAEALAALGVTDTHVMRSGNLRNAVSVGLLSSREMALRHRDALARRGVQALQVAPFDPVGSRYRLEASGPGGRLMEMTRFIDAGARLRAGSCA